MGNATVVTLFILRRACACVCVSWLPQEGSNPLSGWKPGVPEGQRLELGTEHYDSLEARGLNEVRVWWDPCPKYGVAVERDGVEGMPMECDTALGFGVGSGRMS